MTNSLVPPCLLSKSGHQFDLSPLRRISADYFTTSSSDDQFYFNLCGPAIDSHCPPGNSACLTLRSNFTIWYSIGTMDSIETDLSYDDTDPVTILYRMRGKDYCPGSKSFRNFFLKLICSHFNNGTSIPESKPRFIHELDKCSYQFSMISRFACPRVSPTSPIIEDPSCSFLNNRYQLSPLRNPISNYRIETEYDVFWFNACGYLVSNDIDGSKECPPDVAVCALPKDNPSSRVSLGSKGVLGLDDDGVLALTFKDGQHCQEDNHPRVTIIRFPCSSSLTGDRGGFKVIQGHTACGKTIFEFPSSVGCDISKMGPGVGSVIGWIIFSLFLLYVVGRWFYNHFKLGLRGLDAVPHFDTIMDGLEWIQSKFRRVGHIRI